MCKKCGTKWINNRPIDLFKRECCCPICSKENRADKRRKTQEQFVDDLYKVNDTLEVIGKYSGTHRLVKCKCRICGCEFKSYPSNLLNGSAGCPECNLSVGENNIVKFMKIHDIHYTRQKIFKGCKDIGSLRFDVYDEDNNIAIEFQGEQHYFPVDFGGLGDEYSQRSFNELNKRDEIKKNYCKSNGIYLVYVPYTYRNNVDKYLIDNVEIYKEKYAI